MEDLLKLKEIFLSDDIDSEDYQENLDQISEWEKELVENENMKSWQEHDVTKKIMAQAESSYIDLSLRLVSDREITDALQKSIWAKQDACLYIISLASNDVKTAMESIQKKVRAAINVTK